MNALTPLDRLENVFPEIFRGWPRSLRPNLDMQSEIRIDVDEHEKEYIVSAEIPGAKKEDVRVSVDGNYVSISADIRKDTEEKKDGRTLVRETCRGSVSRGFTLGTEVDEQASTASLENGVLKLTLPKRTGSSSKTLTIR